MLLKWQANGQLKLDCTELYAQYSQNVAHLYVLTDVLNKNDGQMFCQFGKWDAATMQYLTLKDENGNPKIYTMGWKVLEKPDSETPSWLYDCYIPAELLTYKDAVCVTLKFQQNGQTGNPDNPTAIFATGNLGFNIEQNLPTGQIIPSDSELAALIAKVNALELNSMTSANTTAYAETLAPTSEATVSVTSTTDSSGQKHFVFNFGIPQGVKGDSGINSALLSNEDGDSDENGFTQQFINKRIAAVIEKIDSLLSSEDGDSETLGYTQSAVNRIANAKVVNSAGTSEAQAYSQAAANATFSNPNLLINPDFTINQRGQTSYSGAVYSWDRWKGVSTNTQVNIQTGVVTCSSGGWFLMQSVEDYEKLRGKTLTATLAYTNLAVPDGDFYIQVYDGVKHSVSPHTDTESGIVSFNFTLSDDATRLSFYLTAAAGKEISVKPLWAKLEVGSVATLFVPPLIAEELSKCKRYYQRYYSVGAFGFFGNCIYSESLSKGILTIDLKQSMRTIPTLQYAGAFSYYTSSGTAPGVSQFSPDQSSDMAYVALVTFVGVPTVYYGFIRGDADGDAYMAFDAEIY